MSPLEPPAPVLRALRAVRRAGTPLCAYVYHLGTVRRTARAVRAALPDRADLYYAVKANGHDRVLAALAPLVAGFEVASLGEARAVTGALGTHSQRPVRAGHPRLLASGPAKTDRELTGLVDLGVAQVNVESTHELRRLARIGAAAGIAVPVALRVNRAGVPLGGSHRMAGVPTQFGLDPDLVGPAVRLARSLPGVDVHGFHLHAVSNNTDATAHAEFVAEAVRWSAMTARRHGVALRTVDVGGGIGVAYDGGPAFDLAAFGAALRSVPVPDGVRLVFELGRFLVAGAGWYAAEVVDVRRTHGRYFAVLRGGMHHFRLPSAWRMNHPFTVLPVDEWPYPWPRPGVSDAAVDVTGELCTPRDVFARDVPVARLRAGDVVVFALAGAYGWEISHHDFLRHPHPAHLVV
ncbi:MAG TPA: alanine racemase [Mycobacteriales bacterium]|nr:alanine racemase [Mycobacteriales bacterium]